MYADTPTHLHACDEAPPNVCLNVCEEGVAAPVNNNLIQHLIHLGGGSVCTAQHSTAQHSTAQHSTTQHEGQR
jgi:hypothetical protein